MAWRTWRRQTSRAALLPAILAGLAFAGLHALYTRARLGRVTITSKPVTALPLAWAGTGLAVAAGALLYVSARSRRVRELALRLAALPTLLAGLLGLAVCAANVLVFAPRIGAGLYNGALALLALGALIVELALLGGFCPLAPGAAGAGSDKGPLRPTRPMGAYFLGAFLCWGSGGCLFFFLGRQCPKVPRQILPRLDRLSPLPIAILPPLVSPAAPPPSPSSLSPRAVRDSLGLRVKPCTKRLSGVVYRRVEGRQAARPGGWLACRSNGIRPSGRPASRR